MRTRKITIRVNEKEYEKIKEMTQGKCSVTRETERIVHSHLSEEWESLDYFSQTIVSDQKLLLSFFSEFLKRQLGEDESQELINKSFLKQQKNLDTFKSCLSRKIKLD